MAIAYKLDLSACFLADKNKPQCCGRVHVGAHEEYMKKAAIAFVFVLLAGCSAGTQTTNQASSDTRGVVLPQQAARPTVVLSPVYDPVGRCRTIYEDSDYMFVARDYGPKGTQIPGLFVFSHKMKKWMEIKELSTEEAKLGRSPTLEEGRCSVGWDYSGLRNTDYAKIPLMTSGSLNFPDKICYAADSATYFLQFNSSWNIDAVLTQFIVKKGDLDKAFGKQETSLPHQGAEGGAVNRAP